MGTKILILGFGFLLSKLPYNILEVIIYSLAKLYLFFPFKRKRLLFSNLSHAFPSWSLIQIRKTALESTARLFEMGFFSLIYPHLSTYERRLTMSYKKEIKKELKELRKHSKPTLILLPHISLFESIVTSQIFRPYSGKTLGAVYRPNSNPSINDWVNKSRTDLGFKIFPRKKGLLQAKKHLANGNWLALLFDQNSGPSGELSIFLDRLCSITPLPDILLKGINANVVIATPIRISFFRTKLELHYLGDSKKGGISSMAHKKLEDLIRNHPEGLPEWLWSHGKWKTQDHPHQIFHLFAKRNALPPKREIPRKTKIWIRMPNWLGDVVMALPLIKAIEHGRPDAEITLLCQAQFKPLLRHLKVGHGIIELPRKGINYFLKVWSLRTRYPDVHFLFTNSLRGDIESWLIDSPLRLGGSMGKKRELLTQQAMISKDFGNKHQVKLWSEYLKYFGLKEAIDYSPLQKVNNLNAKPKVICLAPGSSNTPEKRWPVVNWIKLIDSLIKALPEFQFKLIGTKKDFSICHQIINSFNSRQIKNFAGKTDLVALCDLLASSRCLICNDSGAMHLANAIDVPVFAIFMATNSSITGPVFSSFKEIISPEDITGVEAISNLIRDNLTDLY